MKRKFSLASVLSLALALLMALSLPLGLASCGKGETPAGESSTGGTTAQAEETEDPSYRCDLPDDLNYGDATVHILYADCPGRNDEFVSDGLEAGQVSAAVYERNIAVESQLHVKLDMIPAGDEEVAEKMKRDISGGLQAYDIVANGTFRAVTPAMSGQYLNLSRVENLNTSKSYWTQGFNDLITFTDQDKQFLASGPVAISMFRFVFLTLYNETIMNDRHIPDMYETVMNGDWTLDYQLSIIQDLYLDKNANNKADTGDFFGFVTGNASSVDPYTVAANIHMIVKDPDTKELSYNADAIPAVSDLCDKVQLLYNNAATYVYQGGAEDWAGKTKNIIQAFTAGNAMMCTCLFLDMETEIADLAGMSYGIAPIPKYDKSQSRYYSYVQDQVTSLGISAGIGDADRQAMLGAVMESLAYHSNRLIPPAYYGSTLSLRFMQNPQSKEILDLIFDTIQFDFSSTCSNIFTGCVIRDNLRPLYSGKKNNVSSATRGWESRITKLLEGYNQTISKLD